MAYQITTGRVQKPQRVLIYGPEGVGKTTLAAQFPSPLFIDTEGGSFGSEVRRLPRPDSWQMLLDEVTWVRDYPEECGGTLVVDTLDWAEKLCVAKVCDENDWKSIESPGYGRGYTYVKEEFGRLLNLLSEVVERGLNVCVTAHAVITKFEQPNALGAYDRWGLKLIDGKKASVSAMVKEWADAVLFANFKTILIADDKNDKKVRATGGKNRVLYCTHDASWDAKNRWGLPDEVPMEWAQIAPFVPVPSLAAPVTPAPAEEPAVPFGEEPTEAEREAEAAVAQTMSAAASPDAKPAMPENGGWMGHLVPLMQLMTADGISEDQVCEAVWRKGYAARDQKLTKYSRDVVDWIVSVWPAMREFIRNGFKE